MNNKNITRKKMRQNAINKLLFQITFTYCSTYST